jgi:hypothetical protein
VSNSILTPTAVTREAGRILHQKLNFIGNINRQYDASYAVEGAKIGSALKIRLPNEYTVRTGKTLNTQDTSEVSTTLTVATQKGVDLNFSTAELTLELDDFSERILEPAMSVLAANIEADALSMYKQVPTEVSDVGAAIALADVLEAHKKMTDRLAPMDNRTLLLTTRNNADLVTAASGLYNDRTKVADQYRKGLIGNDFFGFDKVFQNTLLPLHTTGTDDGTGDYLTDIAAGENDGSAAAGNLLNVDTGAGSFAVGDIIEIESVFRVHPETKVSTGELMQFVVTAAATPGAGGGDLALYPSVETSGARQNCTGLADGKAIYKRESDSSTAIGNAADYYVGLGFHKDAFAFATADLVMPKGVDFAAREVMDGISIRIVRDYDINNDNLPCRLDVLYGYKAIRPELAVRLGFN